MQDGSQISLKTLTQHTHLTATLMATGDNDKPVVVRIKRKATKPRLHAFLLEINKRPLKQPLQDFQKLSISASSGKDEIEARKVFVQHVETVTTSEATVDIVKLSVAAVADVLEDKTKSEELRHAFKKDNVLAKDAWFEQIWRSKKEKEKEMHYKALYEMFNFYDIVRVDVEERSNQVQKQEDTCTEDHMLKQDHYVYDYYTVNNDINVDDEDALRSFRQVQVNDGDLFHGSDESEYNSEDSNAKDNQQSVYAKESSSTPLKAINEKLVIVRVKRKASQARLDAFWLEINERPLKRQQLDFEKQSVSDSSGKYEIKARNVFVRHMETVTVSEATVDIVKLFKQSNFADVRNGKIKSEERRRAFKKDNRHDQNLSKARQQQEVLAKTARFEQMWRSRRANQKEIHDKASSEIFHFYDIVRVDVEERSNEVQKQDDRSTDDHISKKDNYVYDYYTEKFDFNVDDDDASFPYTRVHVDDEDFCYWSDESEYVSEDSNAEDCPRKDYSNEMSDEEEDPNAEDNPQNYYPNEASDEEKYSNVTDNPRNDYPNEMSDKEEDSNAENNPRNVYPNEMSDEEEEEEEPPLMNQKTNNPGNYYPCETSDEESDLNADDNPSNYYPYATSDEELDLTETSDEESDLNAEDNPRNYYPYEMSDEESDLNAEDNPQNGYPYEMSDEEADLNSEDCPQDDYPNKMFHEEKEVEGEEGVEESQVSNEMFHEEQEVEEEEGVENQVFNESYNEGESDSIIASIDFEQFSEDEIHYNDIYHDDSHCGYYDDFDNDDGGDDYSDDGGDDYYDDGGGYSDSDDW